MPRFVLLEHRWDGVHWDFLLETGDGRALRSWAVDAPVVAGPELPARALADHRTAYLDYEGEVSGGRGSVRRVDRGLYEVLEWSDDRVRVRVAGDQLVGVVELKRVGRPGTGAEAGGANETPSFNWTFRLGNFD